MDWSNAGKRTMLWKFDGSVLVPIGISLVVFHYVTISILLTYAAVSAYIRYHDRTMTWVLRRFRFFLRSGVIRARTAAYWRKIL